jgi:hypothetical protein
MDVGYLLRVESKDSSLPLSNYYYGIAAVYTSATGGL